MTEKSKKQDCHNERMGFLNAGLPFPRPGQIVAPPAMDRCVARDPTGHSAYKRVLKCKLQASSKMNLKMQSC